MLVLKPHYPGAFGFFWKSKRIKSYISDFQSDEDKESEDNESDAFSIELDDLLDSMEDKDSPEPSFNVTVADRTFISELQENATVHAVSRKTLIPRARCYQRGEFLGIAIDTIQAGAMSSIFLIVLMSELRLRFNSQIHPRLDWYGKD